MREDMFKVIVERPRRGNWRLGTYARNRLAGEDDLPPKLGLRRHAVVTGRRTKSLNETLSPLKRYLAKQVGRPWTKVYAEISEHLHTGHAVKAHVRQHLGDFVADNLSIGRYGELLDNSARFRGARSSMWYQRWYVDPNDGILKDSAKLWRKLRLVNPRARYRRCDDARDHIRRLDDAHELRRIDGLWYEVTFANGLEQPTYDLLKKAEATARTRFASAKRQLSKRELLAHGLTNEP